MLSNIYIFGKLKDGYAQYPSDSSETIFKFQLARSTSSSQIFIHRTGSLVYYSYILNFDKHSIGICVLFNGVCVSDISKLLGIFERAIDQFVITGTVSGLDNKGNFMPLASKLYDDSSQLDPIIASVNSAIEELHVLPLLPIDYTKNIEYVHQVPLSGVDTVLAQNLTTYSYALIYKDVGGVSQRIHSYSSVLRNSHNTITKLELDNQKLRKDVDKLRKQKKQFKLVVFLFLAVISCCFVLFFLNSNLENARDTINNHEITITEMNEKIDSLNEANSNLNSTLAKQKSEIKSLTASKSSLSKKLDSVSQAFPLLITSVSFANQDSNANVLGPVGATLYRGSSKYIAPEITYIGLKEENGITLKVKYFQGNNGFRRGSSSPSDCSYTSTINVYKGNNTTFLRGWGSESGSWPANSYRCEIWYGNYCLYSRSFSVY